MLTDHVEMTLTENGFNSDRLLLAPAFSPLRTIASRLRQNGWPDLKMLNDIADAHCSHAVNANGERIRFVAQSERSGRFEDGFEPRTFLRGEVMVRESNWHDLFNALVWMTFPATKAAINQRHYESLKVQTGRQRSAVGDALTMFDEDGMVVLSDKPELLDLLRRFRWKQLFWGSREAVRARMRFVPIGHALYEKSLNPFIGMTAKSVLLHVPRGVLNLADRALNDAIDQRVAAYVRDTRNLVRGKSLAPLPVLGIPGWWPGNESADFYDDTSYFRSGRSGGTSSESSGL